VWSNVFVVNTTPKRHQNDTNTKTQQKQGGKSVDRNWGREDPDEARKTPFLFSAFPMFVPSLSWQNDRFYIEMAQKWRFVLQVDGDVRQQPDRIRLIDRYTSSIIRPTTDIAQSYD
jgi:hypothetical protein